MRYIGSKSASLPVIVRAIRGLKRPLASFCDPFAGICTVSRHFKSLGYQVVTGDKLRLSYVLQVTYLQLNGPPTFRRLADYLKRNNHWRQAPAYMTVLDYL